MATDEQGLGLSSRGRQSANFTPKRQQIIQGRNIHSQKITDICSSTRRTDEQTKP